MVKKCPKNQILSENISLASIYSSQAIDVHFCVKNSYFLIFIKLAIFVLVYLMNYKKIYHLRTNTTCSGQFCSNSWFCISGSLFWIRKTWSYVHQFSPVKIMIFFLKLFPKENCQIWCRNPILPKFKANNFSIIMTKGIKMAWIIMWHDVSSYLNQSKIRKSKIDKSDLLDTIGPLESVCIYWYRSITYIIW